MEYSKEKLIERAEEALKEIREEIKIAESYLYWKRKDAYRERQHVKHELERTKTDLIEEGYGEDRADEISAEHDLFLTGNLYEEYFKDKGVEIVYFPYTKGTSSTQLRAALSKKK